MTKPWLGYNDPVSKINLADRLSSVEESATLALNARAKQLAAEGRTIYNLTAGELASDTPEHIQKQVATKLAQNKYTPVPGLPELRQEIAKQAAKFYGLSWIKSSNVVVTAGAKPALYVSLLSLVNPGDEVIVPTPAWVSYNSLIELAGGRVVEVTITEDFDLDPEAIAAHITPKTKAILINSPHNPTGATFSKRALTALATKLRGSDITILSDDIYAKLVFDKNFTLVPKCGFEKVVIINGFSKSQALTGWRIGYLIAHDDIAKACTNLLSHTMGNAPLPSQHAALSALERGDQPPREVLKTLKQQRALVAKKLDATPKIKYHLPGGAFYFFIDVREITNDSAKWCEDLLASTGVVLVPGEAFAAPGFARLSFVTKEETLVAGLDKIKEFVSQD